ncbi:glycine cleavage system protein GcvH [Marinobacterium aestuariivivens]|uniref:Glycine cleavage system H protein n=1 Tax=Marinobacterium aestuariivivens TaxID=1698799 RepID=A0ABW2A0B3_9GAMM
MSDIPNELKYVASHEWIRVESDGTVTVGVTDHAQDLLGDVVFVELPGVGSELSSGDEAGVVESVKAASDIYAPLSGEVIEINEDLEESPELVNSDPYGDGWFFKLKLSDTSELDDLLDADGYADLCESES